MRKMAQIQLQRVKKNQFSLLQQKAKLNQLGCGDESTKVFYQAIKARRYHNKVDVIFDHEGVRENKNKEVVKAFINFYKDFFSCKPRKQQVLPTLLDNEKKLDENHLNILQAPNSREDVKRVIFSILDDKAPGADG